MKALEEMRLRFTSGNSVPVERAWVRLEEFEAIEAQFLEVVRQRDLLGQAIADAAFKAGIYNGNVPIDAPMMLMLLDDMSHEIRTRIEDAEATF